MLKRALTPDCWSTYFDLAGRDADLLDDLLHEVRHDDRELAAEVDAGLLLHDLDAQVALAADSACG